MSNEINELRVIKRNSPRFIWKDIEEYDHAKQEYVEERELVFNPDFCKLLHSKLHVPMKKESKELRKLMSKTGLKESEIREKEIYRKQIADAIKNDEIISKEDKLFLKVMRKKGNVLKKPIWDEEVIKATKEYLENIVLDYLSEHPYHVYYCECCNECHKETYSIREYLLFKDKELFPEAKLLKNLNELNHNNIVKKYMILVKKAKKKV